MSLLSGLGEEGDIFLLIACNPAEHPVGFKDPPEGGAGTGEMAQQFRALVLAMDSSSNPSTYMAAHNTL